MLKGLSSHTWLPACSKFLQGVSSRGKSPLSSRNLNGAPPRDNAAAPPNRQTGGVVFGIACAGYATFLLSVTGRLIYNNRRRREEKRRLATLEPAAKGGGDVHVFWVLAPGRKSRKRVAAKFHGDGDPQRLPPPREEWRRVLLLGHRPRGNAGLPFPARRKGGDLASPGPPICLLKECLFLKEALQDRSL
ncbi:uncharacterized protein LOC125039197 isoform X2 [Penaeus chinensis]|uniref:uncharacterized protein LOC125039197 isoform X2 n=1 Tax=Penaeus chinensis TaxID=139456 RepID=UPI001FB6C588|nr:uncharacterized protein LOC125039197 isoform X2 [Penaeus chinensis]